MKLLDCVELIAEKDEYAKYGVHKGMQGTIWDEKKINGYWLVYFTRYAPNEDYGDIPILEEDLMLLPNGFSNVLNEDIEAQFKNI